MPLGPPPGSAVADAFRATASMPPTYASRARASSRPGAATSARTPHAPRAAQALRVAASGRRAHERGFVVLVSTPRTVVAGRGYFTPPFTRVVRSSWAVKNSWDHVYLLYTSI
ncbi:hypothetical protein ZWY2020_004667 [Hordeum vulgare]|nr:hypothetical protein ZWY2020_004667 [Hordeum vulgare]